MRWAWHYKVMRRTAAHEALVLCRKFYPWRVEQAREAMYENALVKKAQAGK